MLSSAERGKDKDAAYPESKNTKIVCGGTCACVKRVINAIHYRMEEREERKEQGCTHIIYPTNSATK
jgi:hypothetical protein